MSEDGVDRIRRIQADLQSALIDLPPAEKVILVRTLLDAADEYSPAVRIAADLLKQRWDAGSVWRDDTKRCATCYWYAPISRRCKRRPTLEPTTHGRTCRYWKSNVLLVRPDQPGETE